MTQPTPSLAVRLLVYIDSELNNEVDDAVNDQERVKGDNVPSVVTSLLAVVNDANDTGQKVHENCSAQRARVADNIANTIVKHGREAPDGDDDGILDCNHHVARPLVIKEEE